ncbi:ATP-binding protein [Croceitalea rosinachiae]|uniref:histidine kinase n=1 Tax=Croceitalea rosinachiae TaxID=3075596 RepID=A0ABU3ADE4_9FLAO|nr:ATP-binding protein [Croceitalea sp. F388]MDT0607532.1 ATP-binding protein [Croceitalea sp. F388]
MDTRELLSQLSKLENGLDRFSFSELNSSEAAKLKRSFASFKNGLETKVFGDYQEIAVDFEEIKPSNISTREEHNVIANVSHEIRTPLNGIMGFIDLLKETELSQEQLELISALGSASQNLMNITNELLEFSKLATGREKFTKVPFNLNNLVNEVGFLCKTLITNKNIALNVTLDKNVPKNLVGDPSRLSQILLNLLGNAIKFVQKGKIELVVSLKANETHKTYLQFNIMDTGIGIANDKLKQIFETYKQAESDIQLKYGGSGLGLSIVKELVEKLGGCIAVSSTLGKGTTFKVVLPFEKNTKGAEQKKLNTPSNPNKKKSLTGTKILVFEDNMLNQKLMENRLKTWGCDTFITDNGIYGLKLLENHHFDLVLMDLKMPNMSGFQISDRIRNSVDKQIKNIPIIALSADYSSVDKENCDRVGITDFILKPYNADELHALIEHNLYKINNIRDIRSKTVPIVDESRLVNLDSILEECLGQTELLDELIRLFKQNIFEFIGKVKMHLQSNNVQGIGFATHKIKSSLKMMETRTLSEICEQISEVCKTSSNHKNLDLLYDRFLKEYPKVERQIDYEINKLKTN